MSILNHFIGNPYFMTDCFIIDKGGEVTDKYKNVIQVATETKYKSSEFIGTFTNRQFVPFSQNQNYFEVKEELTLFREEKIADPNKMMIEIGGVKYSVIFKSFISQDAFRMYQYKLEMSGNR